MKLFLTTHKRVTGPLPLCTREVCRFSGHKEPHVCFSSAPLYGRGNWVYEIEYPGPLEDYEYEHLFRDVDVNNYAIPVGQLKGLARKENTYEALTGRPWNRWVVKVSDRHLKGQYVDDSWALVWRSPKTVANASVLTKDQHRGKELIEMEIEVSEDFDPETDYVIEERRWYVDTPAGLKDKFRLVLHAGSMPKWASFPWAWSKWVFTDENVLDAVEHITRTLPQVTNAVHHALQVSQASGNKASIVRAWRSVADQIRQQIGRDLGELSGHSWTAVQAMPIRIASRLGGWEPKNPKPEFEHPDESGRVLLASPEGAYPSRAYSYERQTEPLPPEKREPVFAASKKTLF